MTIGNTEDAGATSAPTARLPYVAPFLRRLDVEDSGGFKPLIDTFESTPTTGPS